MADAQCTALIHSGLKLMLERGYSRTGARDIAAAADVPHGSFTNYFRSKEVFALGVLDAYFENVETLMKEASDGKGSGLEKLQRYCFSVEKLIQGAGWKVGCLIPDLVTKMSAESEPMRRKLEDILRLQAKFFAEALSDLTGSGDDPVGDFVLAAWQGTLIRTKATQNPAPFRSFEVILKRFCEDRRKSGPR